MFLQNERGLGVKNGALGTIEQVSAQSMAVQTDDGRSIAFDFKDYDKFDHGYVATIHKAQGMTVDRTHVLATPGIDTHGSYVALSRHRDGMDLHYGRDDFASQDKLINTLSRDRAKDMASDYYPTQDYAERRGITFRACVTKIMRKLVPEHIRDRIGGMFDGVRQPGDSMPAGSAAPEIGAGKGRANDGSGHRSRDAAGQQIGEDPEAALRRARGRAFVRHARAVDAIFKAQEQDGKASAEQVQELRDARGGFDDLRPQGSRDAEAVYKRNPEFAADVASGERDRAAPCNWKPRCARTPTCAPTVLSNAFRNSGRPANIGMRRGDYSGYRAARAEMGKMAMSLERDAQMDSLLRGRKPELGIDVDSGHSLGRDLAISHGLGRGRGIGL